MTLFISIVNHNHDDIITKNNELKKIAKTNQVIIKSNTNPKGILVDYCKKSGIHLVTTNEKKGFGANNNEVFNYAKNKLGMSNKDHFLVMNPDVTINLDSIAQLQQISHTYPSSILTINLYLDKNKKIYDESIRKFPSPMNPFKGLFKIKRQDIYDKATIFQPTAVDWAAGSFLLFQTSNYETLHGFDESYFMYYEDVDICLRAKRKGINVIYLPSISAVHDAAYDNRKMLNKLSLRYAISYFRYFFRNVFN
ncbi:glycosyltransferase family 2 protein [Vibrio sonorensis]|uniref:glycosyltransferase family 2 protein n=1 Tax=Vibrio sonorensis TaxID=1004316 RepID=UPI0008D9DCE6|nr:glycosyltransferase family 2 protein [Vibrio sonorensis]